MKPMDTSHPPAPEEDWLDQALHRHAESLPDWLADDGFSDRVMQSLPPVRRRRRAARWWPVIGGGLGGVAMVAVDPSWQVVPALFSRIDHPGVMLAVVLMLVPVLLTGMVLLLLVPGSD